MADAAYSCPCSDPSMSKAEIQTLIPLICGRCQILFALSNRHGVPLPVTVAIAQDVVYLGEYVEPDIHNAE